MQTTKRWLALPAVVAIALMMPGVVRAEVPGAPALADDPTLVALAVALACADAPQGGEAKPAAAPAEPPASGPELELVATVHAKTLRFAQVPQVQVVFRGSGARRTVWRTERVNLPMHPQPGVDYHDVEVRLTVSSTLEELGALLRQAKLASRGIRIENDPPAATPAAPASPAAAARPSAGAAAPAATPPRSR